PLHKQLFNQPKQTYPLHPHNLPHPLNKNLPFTPQHPSENIPPIPQLPKLILHPPPLTLTPFISPYKQHRQTLTTLLHHNNFIQLYTKSTLHESENTHPKPFYKKPRSPQIPQFTPITPPYQPPQNPQITIDTQHHTIQQSVQQIIPYLKEH
ncbi:adenylyl-sulfate kinase, partial [Staphylococcus epidermidis]|uniref:adenylyl-sulfate kinase n=1 Tax=Staphylococcus epidermidis TaxID=1282 RepID=UPI0011AA2534